MRALDFFVCLALASVCAPEMSAAAVWRLDRVTPLKGPAPGWDYLTFDADTGRLFIGRRAAGVTVYDTRAHRLIGQIEASKGANAATLAPAAGRGYTTNGDGTSTVFDLVTLKTLGRIKLGESADSAFHDVATGQLVFTLGDSKELVFVEARTGVVTGRLNLPATELETVVPDGTGTLYVVERDLNRVARVDSRTRRLLGEWSLSGCEAPTGAALDRASGRLFLGCKGEHPVLAVVDVASGTIVARPPIGRGNDGVVWDGARKLVYTSNGVDGNLVIYRQAAPDRYELASAVTTRPIARTLALDPASGHLFTATAEGRLAPARPGDTRAGAFYPNVYYDDTFVLLEYAPVEGATKGADGE